MSIHRKFRVFGIRQISRFIGFLETTMQPRPQEQLLGSFRLVATSMLSTDIAVDGSDTHKVVPAPDRKTRNVHLVKETSAIFVGPVTVVGGMGKPLGQQFPILFGNSSNLIKRFKSFWTGRSADAVAFMKQAQPCIDHILSRKMRLLSHRQKVLREACLGTSKGPYFSGRPWLSSQPFHQIVTILSFTPAERSIPAPHSFGFLRPSKIGQDGDVSPCAGQPGKILLSPGVIGIGISLFEQHGPGAISRRSIDIGRQSHSIPHGDHDMGFRHSSQINGIGSAEPWRPKENSSEDCENVRRKSHLHPFPSFPISII